MATVVPAGNQTDPNIAGDYHVIIANCIQHNSYFSHDSLHASNIKGSDDGWSVDFVHRSEF
jgi:hypothetical protein